MQPWDCNQYSTQNKRPAAPPVLLLAFTVQYSSMTNLLTKQKNKTKKQQHQVLYLIAPDY